MFMLFEYMFPIIFVIVFGMIIFQFVTGIRTWHKNNQSPRLSVSATIVAKRENITYHSHANAGDLSGAHGFHSTSSTSYYVTFQVESGGPDGIAGFWQRIWNAGGRRHWETYVSGNEISVI